jgi:peptide/nickel transport system substrate-binding protein
MLDAAGYPVQSNGFRFKMNLLFDSGVPTYSQTAQALSSFWRDVGVDVQLVGLDRTTQLQRVFTDWNFDAVSVAYTTSGDPALGVQRAYITSSILKSPFTNGSGYSNPEVDMLFKQAQDAPTREERAKYYYQAETILAAAMPTLPLVEYSSPGAASAKLHGLDQGVDSYSWWSEAWLEP